MALSIYFLSLLGITAWVVWLEICHHDKTGDYCIWRLNLIWLLVFFLLIPVIGKGCNRSYSGHDGDAAGWEDR